MAPNEGHPMHPTWVEYALTTNERGAATVAKLEAYRTIRSLRALDVGCAFAGFPIAFARAGAEAVGVELDPTLLRLAEANVRDAGVPVELHRMDLLDDERVRELGRFDLITCADVIEHVDDVPRALANMAALLAPGGLLYLQVPNGFSTALVLKDGHFGLFGITLLGRDDAERYYREARFTGTYDVGTFHPLDFYLQVLAEHDVALVDLMGFGDHSGAGSIEAIRRQLAEIDAAAGRLGERDELSEETRECIRTAVGRHRLEVTRALDAYGDGMEPAEDGTALRDDLVRRFGMSCWEVVARKRDPMDAVAPRPNAT
jgi:2-polyprenyl-3-methyl-5-hydroxy-6-metoxy-1,4-benzoquinol methylase